MIGFKTIMVTTDFSDTSQRALPFAAELAVRYGARLLVVYVEENRLPPLVVEYAATGFDDMLQQQRDRAEHQLQGLVEEHFRGPFETEAEVLDGTAHVEIVRRAREAKTDLIVMATHGRGFISHAILGSTTERVVRRAPCPVLVVRGEQEV